MSGHWRCAACDQLHPPTVHSCPTSRGFSPVAEAMCLCGDTHPHLSLKWGEIGHGPAYTLKTTEKSEEFPTGSRRNSAEGKGRPDLIPIPELRRLAMVYERGAKAYGDDNWKKGQDVRRYYASALRHLMDVMEGKEDEDHTMQAAWNCISIAWTLRAIKEGRLPPELDNRKQVV